ncbi:MAG TPA: hypothetical protein VHV31_03060, partial [Nitrolancea sp.]|nr:hypothetical protein [Nitrolancea sp.]
MRRWGIEWRWLVSMVVVLSSLGVALGSSGGIALAAGTTYTSCVQASSFPTDLANVTSGSATFTFPADCTLDLTSSLAVAAGVSITVDGAGLVLDGQTQTFDIMKINDTLGNPSSLTLDDVTVTHGQNGITDSGNGALITLTDSTVSDNSGDGIHANGVTGSNGEDVNVGLAGGFGGPGGAGGAVTLMNSTVNDNGASGITVNGGTGGAGGGGGLGGPDRVGGAGGNGGNGGA